MVRFVWKVCPGSEGSGNGFPVIIKFDLWLPTRVSGPFVPPFLLRRNHSVTTCVPLVSFNTLQKMVTMSPSLPATVLPLSGTDSCTKQSPNYKRTNLIKDILELLIT